MDEAENTAPPIGFAASAAEWDEFELQCAEPRPYTIDLWNQLTFGDQERYAALEMASRGTTVALRNSGDRAVVTITLPVDESLSANELKWLEGALQNKALKTLGWIIRGREFGVADRPPKTNGLSGLF